MNPLTKQTLIIDVDGEDGTYRAEFLGCKFSDIYRVLRAFITEFESGVFFEKELEVYDKSGKRLTREQATDIIRGIKEELDNSR